MAITSRIKSAWNAFVDEETPDRSVFPSFEYGSVVTYRPDRPRVRLSNERSIISAIYARIGIDISSVQFRHTRHDDNDRYIEDIESGLNECLKLETNMDQTAQAFFLDVALTLFDKGVAAIVPVDTTLNPNETGGYDIKTMRVGEVVEWNPGNDPSKVKLSVYNERKGKRQDIVLSKSLVALVPNPLYTVMNEPSSTLQRLIRKLNLLDAVDEQSSSGKLDLIIQLPYVIKSESRRQQAEQRRKDVEFQLKGSQYGVAYTDGTEKITQLNRPVENQLLNQVQYLTDMLYSQLGLTPEVMNGTADEKVMLNYNNRTIKPIVIAIKQEMMRTFLTKTARSQKQAIDFFLDPFSLVPVSQIAEIGDKLSRNEVMTSNELRQILWMKPAKDPKADQLVNSNMPQGSTPPGVDPANASTPATPMMDPTVMQQSFDDIDSAIDDAFSGLGLEEGAPNAPPS